MTHKNDEGGEGRWEREEASEVGGERKLSKKEEDAETKCKKRRKRGKEQNIMKAAPCLQDFCLPFSFWQREKASNPWE